MAVRCVTGTGSRTELTNLRPGDATGQSRALVRRRHLLDGPGQVCKVVVQGRSIVKLDLLIFILGFSLQAVVLPQLRLLLALADRQLA